MSSLQAKLLVLGLGNLVLALSVELIVGIGIGAAHLAVWDKYYEFVDRGCINEECLAGIPAVGDRARTDWTVAVDYVVMPSIRSFRILAHWIAAALLVNGLLFVWVSVVEKRRSLSAVIVSESPSRHDASGIAS